MWGFLLSYKVYKFLNVVAFNVTTTKGDGAQKDNFTGCIVTEHLL